MTIESANLKLARLRLEQAKEAVRVAEAEAAESARRWYMGQEPKAGSMIKITATFSNDRTYEYLAYRPDSSSHWYLTGRAGQLTWEEIFHRMKAADIAIERLNFK